MKISKKKMNQKIKVLLADDQLLVRQSVSSKLNLSDDITVIGQASSGEEAIKLARELLPDVIIMDIQMPGIGGLEATMRLNQGNTKFKVLVLTASENELLLSCFLQVGALGYVAKSANFDELFTAIRKVNVGERYVFEKMSNSLTLNSLSNDKKQERFKCLTQREMQIFFMLITGDSTEGIADTLCLSHSTVSSYRSRILNKLNIQGGDVELTYLALECGLLDDLSELARLVA